MGLAFLHTRTPPVYHADVKPVSLELSRVMNTIHPQSYQGNTLVNDDERGILCDFGLSKALGDATSGLTTTKTNFTIRYASPELLLHDVQSLPNDTWAWGCLLLHVSVVILSVSTD